MSTGLSGNLEAILIDARSRSPYAHGMVLDDDGNVAPERIFGIRYESYLDLRDRLNTPLGTQLMRPNYGLDLRTVISQRVPQPAEAEFRARIQESLRSLVGAEVETLTFEFSYPNRVVLSIGLRGVTLEVGGLV